MQQQLTLDDIAEMKMHKIALLIEKTLLNTTLAVLHRLDENQSQQQYICYKSDCPMRDDIPF